MRSAILTVHPSNMVESWDLRYRLLARVVGSISLGTWAVDSQALNTLCVVVTIAKPFRLDRTLAYRLGRVARSFVVDAVARH
jgi:hypothetical protein